MNRSEEIRRIVAAALAEAGDDEPFTDEESLFVTGRLSSLDIVGILTELEQRFSVEVEADDFDPMQLDSVASIGALLDRCGV